MKVEQLDITIGEVANGYHSYDNGNVVAYDGKLNVQPAYQREFVYNEEQRSSVIRSVRAGFPLNAMYWAKNEDGTYELMDGQQRTRSVCDFVTGLQPANNRFMGNLTNEEQEQIMNYKLMVYVCEGPAREKLDWFRIINMQGMPLTPQELLNAIYTGPWLASAKTYFSKQSCPASQLSDGYVSGSTIRQELLELAIRWISKGNVEAYMAQHQNDTNANELWLYFQSVINWARLIFPDRRAVLKSVDWSRLYDLYHATPLDATSLMPRVAELMIDDDVTNKRGIYEYVLDNDDRHLNIRRFTERNRRDAYERSGGVCAKCGKTISLQDAQADHITPWSKGGKTVLENCQILCSDCNRRKSNV